jgi:hypothetical protein
MRRPPVNHPPQHVHLHQQPIVATVLPFPNNNNHHNATQKRVLRGRIYLAIVVILIVQAVVLPWFLMPTTTTTSSSSSTTYNNNKNDPPIQHQPSDGTFNNHPIYLRHADPNFHSGVHCVGETHNVDTAWMYRSCHFSNLCIDTSTKEFVLFQNPTFETFQRKRVPHAYISTDLSSNNTTSLALGGINPRWQGNDFNQGIHKVKWFPKVLAKPPETYYELDPSVLLVPFHSFAAHNVGHMLWDDFLPLFTLLSLFFDDVDVDVDIVDKKRHRDLLLLRVDTLPLLYGTCEMRRNKQQKCAKNFEKFLPLLGVDPKTFSTVKTMQLSVSTTTSDETKNTNKHTNEATPSLVCAKHAVAGLGMLTDHGMKDHGWQPGSETRVQNTAKGALLYTFRNFMLQNLGIPVIPVTKDDGQFRILLSAHSSGDGPRDVSFLNQHNVLQLSFPTATLTTVELATIEMHQQIQQVSQTNVFVSTCGGGSMTATFLPRGATLILYYQQTGGFDFAAFNFTSGPAYLDWDLFNNAAYLRVHWLPIETMDTKEGLESLMYLVRHEMEMASMGL